MRKITNNVLWHRLFAYFCIIIFQTMRHIISIIICSALIATGCENNSTSETTTPATESIPAPQPQSNLGDNGTNGLMNVVKKYFALKNSLVATKAEEASAAATQLITEASSFATAMQGDSVHAPSIKPYLDTIITQSKVITTFKDETCEQQRIAFEIVSRAVYGMAKASGLKNARVYHQYCPMAFNDKGAFWLSDNSEIQNPYFGKKMLECGEVTDSL